MKKLVLSLLVLSVLAACNGAPSVDAAQLEMLRFEKSPFKEYDIIEKDVVKSIEASIIAEEIADNGFVPDDSAAHVTNFTKIGDYAYGEVRIIAKYTPEKMEELKRDNALVVSNTTFEYSYTLKKPVWTQIRYR